MHRTISVARYIVLALCILTALYVPSIAYAEVVENIENTCPSDPTMNGKCGLGEMKVDNPSCKTVGGQEVCRDWWRKDFKYKCSGAFDPDTILAKVGNQYCDYKNECSEWIDVEKHGGETSCRIYVDLNRPGCNENSYGYNCIVNDCGDLFERCFMKQYVKYSDIPDKSYQPIDATCDPTIWQCTTQTNPSVSGIKLGLYTFSCPSDVRKVCKTYSGKVKCPDGREQACNKVKTCKQQKTVNTKAFELKSCIAQRNMQSYTYLKNTTDADNLKADNSCIKTLETIDSVILSALHFYENRFGSGGDIVIGSSSYTCPLSGGSACSGSPAFCVKGQETALCSNKIIFTGSGSWPQDGQTITFTGNGNKIDISTGSQITFPEWITISGQISSGTNNALITFSGSGNVLSASGNMGGGTLTFGGGIEVSGSFTMSLNNGVGSVSVGDVPVAKTYENFNCYQDSYQDCSFGEGLQCNRLSSLDINDLECVEYDLDIDNPQKAQCKKYIVNYECPKDKQTTECAEYEEILKCNDGIYPIKDVRTDSHDFSADFAKAMALAQATNELKHVWSGEPYKCESGTWWLFDSMSLGDYLMSKMMSMAFQYLGSEIMSITGIQTTISDGMGCMNNVSSVILSGSTWFGDGLSNVQSVNWKNPNNPAGGMDITFKNPDGTIGTQFQDTSTSQGCVAALGQNIGQAVGLTATQAASVTNFLSNSYVLAAGGILIDLATSIKNCSTCTDESCATRYNQYKDYSLISNRLCHQVGNKCTSKLDFGLFKKCLRTGYKHCCYNSKFARILVEQAYAQLGYSWGNFDNPLCTNLTFDDLKRLDFSSMDFSEFIEEVTAKMKGNLNEDALKQRVQDRMALP